MRNRGGFTIIETLIVLAVTGALVVATMGSIGGRQGRTEFTQSMREIEARVRDTLNDVSNGFYPVINNLKCTASGSNGPPILSHDPALGAPGRNAECVLAGKVIQLGTNTNASESRVYSMAGRRTVTIGTTTRDVSNIAELKPKVIKVNSGGNVLDATEYSTLPSDIQLVGNDETTVHYANIGIYYRSFGGQSPTGQSSGVASVSIANLPTAAHTEGAVIAKAEGVQETDFLSSSESILLCFKSGTSNQFASLRLKGDSGGFTTELDLDIKLIGLPCV